MLANPALLELRMNLHAVEDILKTSRNDLFIFEAPYVLDLPSDNSPGKTDRCITRVGLDGLPFIHGNFPNSGKRPYPHGLGIEVRELRQIRYAIYRTKDNQNALYKFVIVRKKDYQALRRAAKRSQWEAFECNRPILVEGMLEEIIRESVHFLRNYRTLKKYGVRPRRGILLRGKPGNGKTLTCRYLVCLAARMGLSATMVTGAGIENAFHNNRLAETMSSAELVILNDIDAAYLNRLRHDKITCALLDAMDGMYGQSRCVRVLTTNEELSDMDPAFRRPGRIDRVFELTPPNLELRSAFVSSWPVDLGEEGRATIARNTDNHSFADLEAVRAALVGYYLDSGKWDGERALKVLEKEDRVSRPGF